MKDIWKEWQKLEQPQQVDELIESSRQQPQLIFKHSPRCSISVMVQERMAELTDAVKTEEQDMGLHTVDVVNARQISDYITQQSEIRHESPQVLLWSGGNVQWHASHLSIKNDEILEALQK